MPSTRALLRAPWSASKVQMALRCPREFHYRYVENVPEPEVMGETRIGKAVHRAMERALSGESLAVAVAEAREILDDAGERDRFDQLIGGIAPFLRRISEFRLARRSVRQLVEYSLAVREDLTTTPFYAGDAFYRGVFDVGYLYDDGNMAIVDHKTGFRLRSQHIDEQLQGYAVLAAAHFRNVNRFWLGVHWVADADMEWQAPLAASEIQQRILPAVLDNIEAAALAVDDGPRPNPGAWCGHCSYRSLCPAALEARFELVDYEPDPGTS